MDACTGGHGMRVRRALAGAAAVGMLVVSTPPAALATVEPTATLNGHPIALVEVSQYACHDRRYPQIRCFRTSGELAVDEQVVPAGAGPASPMLLSPFVRWYQNSNYGGAFFDAYTPYADLSVIGWANQISSFTPLYGGHPGWWEGANYTGTGWDWGTSPVPNLGPANDRIRSVRKR